MDVLEETKRNLLSRRKKMSFGKKGPCLRNLHRFANWKSQKLHDQRPWVCEQLDCKWCKVYLPPQLRCKLQFLNRLSLSQINYALEYSIAVRDSCVFPAASYNTYITLQFPTPFHLVNLNNILETKHSAVTTPCGEFLSIASKLQPRKPHWPRFQSTSTR